MERGSATGPSWRLGGCHGRLVWPTWLTGVAARHDCRAERKTPPTGKSSRPQFVAC